MMFYLKNWCRINKATMSTSSKKTMNKRRWFPLAGPKNFLKNRLPLDVKTGYTRNNTGKPEEKRLDRKISF